LDRHRRWRPDVVLIEDKASGTQLIQELVADGLYAVARYRPQADKVMRMHAQTAVPGLDPGIENGFVHLPQAAPWLAEYLHELAVFPNGRFDDQVDATAQFLDWCKMSGREDGIYALYRMRYEELQKKQRAGAGGPGGPHRPRPAPGNLRWRRHGTGLAENRIVDQPQRNPRDLRFLRK
jgi:predicted phage terminase large subunit-like protein